MATVTIKKRTGDWFAETESVTLVLTAEEAFALRAALSFVDKDDDKCEGSKLARQVFNELTRCGTPVTDGEWVNICKGSLTFRKGPCQEFVLYKDNR